MTTLRESLTTLIDFEGKSPESYEEPDSLARKKPDLSGGRTMWQARLVLSTLEPDTEWAADLRAAIRRGDIEVADELLGDIYSRSEKHSSLPPVSTGPKSGILTTVLPPAPRPSNLKVG